MQKKNNIVSFFSVKRFEREYQDGYFAFSHGVFGVGPYPANSMKRKEWRRGWDRAYFENLEKINAQA